MCVFLHKFKNKEDIVKHNHVHYKDEPGEDGG